MQLIAMVAERSTQLRLTSRGLPARRAILARGSAAKRTATGISRLSAMASSSMDTASSRYSNRAMLFYLSFLYASNLVLLLFSLLPTGIGVVFLHSFGVSIGLLAEILLIHHSIQANDERHHAGRSVFRWIGHECDSLGHLPVHDVSSRAAWAIFSLTREDVVIVTAVRRRSPISACGIPLS